MEDNKSMTVKKTVKSGITFGSALAWLLVIQRGSLSAGRFFMDYLVGCMSYISFCAIKFFRLEIL